MTAQTITISSIGEPPRGFFTPCSWCGCSCSGHSTPVTIVVDVGMRLSIVTVPSIDDPCFAAVKSKIAAPPFHEKLNRKPWERRR